MRIGRPLSEETKRKIAENHVGKVYSKERVRRAVHGRYGNRPPITKAELEDLYFVKALTQLELAEHFKVSPAAIKTLIHEHGLQLTEAQRALRIQAQRHVHWKNGVTGSRGYRLVLRRDHPNATKQGRVCQHRLVVEEFIGRHLNKLEEVHHLNFDRGDSRIENLVLFACNKDHALFHQWTHRVGAYFLGILATPPEPLKYDAPILVGGRWLREINIKTWSRMASAA